MTRVLIVGAGGHAQVIADLLASRARSGEDIGLIGFVDDDARLIGTEILGVRVLGTPAEMDRFAFDAVVVGIGENATWAHIYRQLIRQGRTLLSLVHPRATVAADVELGAGSVVFAGAVINTGAVIGPDVIINTGATVDHHAQIGAHVHLAPGVHLGGTVTIGEGTFIGIGSSVIPNCQIGAWTVVGAGAAVINDLPARVTTVGVPARIIDQAHLNLANDE